MKHIKIYDYTDISLLFVIESSFFTSLMAQLIDSMVLNKVMRGIEMEKFLHLFFDQDDFFWDQSNPFWSFIDHFDTKNLVIILPCKITSFTLKIIISDVDLMK